MTYSLFILFTLSAVSLPPLSHLPITPCQAPIALLGVVVYCCYLFITCYLFTTGAVALCPHYPPALVGVVKCL